MIGICNGGPSFCFDCLQRRIESDFSEKIVFCHGISDSPLPFGSSAVVELSSSSGGGDGESSSSQSQFIVTYIPVRQCRCLSDYVDEYIDGDSQPNLDHTSDDGTTSCSRNQVGGRSSSFEGEASSRPWRNESDCSPDSSPNKHSELVGSVCECCGYFHKYSFDRMINTLAPVASVGFGCYSKFEDIASDFSSGSLEDHTLLSLSLLIEGKATGRDSLNFLNMIGMPGESTHPGCLRHPNIIPIIGILKSSENINFVLPKVPYTLESILHFSPDAIKSEWDIKLLIYQILSALVYMHGMGFAHGNICPSSIAMTKAFWPLISICDKPGLGLLNHKHTSPAMTTKIVCCENDCVCQGLYTDLNLSLKIDWHTEFTKWWKGELSNFEYLLILNELAGRRWGDHTFYPVMPWVIDFSTRPDESAQTGWRDLSKSKWRLAKGDEQLDFTYLTSEVPHHVSDECLSELAVCSYKARRLPLSILRLAVRSVYEPNEYPSTMQRLYQWTPDECIPEFYFDFQIFHSIHSGMADLAVPAWAGTAEEFIKIHRAALESDRVSSQIHNWIDITFGYKMSGEAAIAAKNVMLASSEPIVPRYSGRRQLFTQPHPMCRGYSRMPRYENNSMIMHQRPMTEIGNEKAILPEAANLQELEAASKFADHARYLCPVYFSCLENASKDVSCLKELAHCGSEETRFKDLDIGQKSGIPFRFDTKFLLEHMEWEDAASMGYQELLLWRQKISPSESLTRAAAEDIFSVGCVLAELILRRPLFDQTSFPLYVDDGIIPDLVQELPPPARVIVEACIQKEWLRRPSAKSLLESPYFPSSVSSAYLFLAPLQLLAKDGSRLRYLASFVKQGALKVMGTLAAEKCALSCLPLVLTSTSDTEAEWACIVLKEFVKCLKPSAVKTQVLPCIQKILQTTGYSHLKVSILQDSFVREIWNQVGKHVYLDTLHPLVLSNLHISPYKSSATAAAVLLIGSSEELGIPITIHQTILPLIHCFGKGICPDGIDALVRIGGLLGDSFIVGQMFPLLKQVAYSCISISGMNRPEPVQSWSGLALVDCLVTLHGLLLLLPREVIVKEIFEGGRCLHVTVLMQSTIEISVLQVAATSLLAVCQRIGPDLTAVHVLPQIKDLFDGLAFSQDTASRSGGSTGKSFKHLKSKSDRQTQMESRMDLVLLLYPSLASILGIEKLRQCCATWLLLEQFLLRCHNWKWEQTEESSQSSSEFFIAKRPIGNQGVSTDYRPAKMLLNGFGWSIPQAQANRSVKKSPSRKLNKLEQSPAEGPSAISNYIHHEQWSWFPSPVIGWDGPEFLSRLGGSKEELPWKIRASVVHSVRAHHGALRSLAVCGDESIVYTAGIGQGFKGTVEKWDLARMSCVSGYYGHEEVVNDICVLSTSGMLASCDGTIHVWNSRTGKLASVFSEACTNTVHFSSYPLIQSGNSTDQINMLNSTGILTGTFDGSLYTCMHYLEFNQKLVAGTGNGSLRFIDIAKGQKLHSWKGDSVESGFPSLVSAICSSASDEMSVGSTSASSCWIAAGLSSGYCRLFDLRCGDAIASWQPHDGYITKLAVVEGHLLVSSSLDRTLQVWDLRRSPSAQLSLFRGHTDGVSGFSLWGQDVISISRNKIGLSSLSKSADEDGVHRITPQKLRIGNQGSRNMSVLSSISILPFSRLFVVGTEDGYLRICC